MTVPSQVVDFIDDVFPLALRKDQFNVDMQFRDRVSALLRLVDELDPELVTFTGRDYSQYVATVEGVRSAVRVWDAHGVPDSISDRRLGDTIIKLRWLVSELDDVTIPSETAELTFIPEHDLRDSIREDIASSDQAYSAHQWKSATVMAGAAVEALLLWKINLHPAHQVLEAFRSLKLTKVSENPDDWTLEIYRRVATKLGVIRQDADDLTKLAQQYRNLIHPGVARRRGRKCTRSTALTALAAMNRLIEDFSYN
jgi:hypothetical protein